MRLKLIAIVLALAIILSTLWINAQNDAVPSSNIKIGILAPLTGNYSTFGERIRNGMELAKSDLVAQNPNRRIELVLEDSCQPADTVSAFHKMTGVDGVQWIGGSFCLVGFVPVIPLAQEKQTLLFNTAANPDSVLNQPYVFSFNKSIQSDAQGLADYAQQTLTAQSAAIVFYNTPLGNDYNTHLTQRFIANGGQITSTHVTELNETDFRTVLSKIKGENPDAVFIIQLSNSLGLFLKQARELGIDSAILSHSEAEDPKVLQAAQSAAEGLIISSSKPNTKTESILDFETRYESRFGSKPDILAAIAFDSLKLQVDAFETCDYNTECMKTKLFSIAGYDGASGLITMNPNGSTDKPTNFKKVQNGEFVEID